MLKFCIFDIDGTLAPVGKPVNFDNLEKIKLIESKGVKIGLCSGKPIYYQCGFARMMGLNEPILIGDVGGTVQLGIDLPPKETYIMPYDGKVKENLIRIKAELEEKYGDELWFEPTAVGVTPFPRSQKGFMHVREYIAENPELFIGTTVYEYFDSFDIMPKEIHKGVGVGFACKLLGVNKEETAAVGDGINDYTMLGFANESFGINFKDKSIAKHNVSSLSEALDIILSLI